VHIGITVDLVPDCVDLRGAPDDLYEEFDSRETVEAIAEALRSAGHVATVLPSGRDLLQLLLAAPPDFVWNMAEGTGVGRCREARVPAILEMLQIPFTGSDPLTLAVALDKDMARTLVATRGVTVAKGVLLRHENPQAETQLAQLAESIGFPLLLKPAWEGSSKGIRGVSLVRSMPEALKVWQELAQDYRQPILVEEFIDGIEVTVGVVGNGSTASVIGSMAILPREAGEAFVYSLEVKRDYQRRVHYEVPAPLTGIERNRLHASALNAYSALGCRDLARIDFRMRGGVPYFLEANPLPGLAPVKSDLVILAHGMGITHEQLIHMILRTSLDRLGLHGSERS
jgi:D-alanine-D-alanine ligase